MNENTRALKHLVDAGKARGYVRYSEIDELLPASFQGGPELDDILAELHHAGVEVVDEREPLPEISERPWAPPDDPVEFYLRTVAKPPLTRAGEIRLTQQIAAGGKTGEAARCDLIDSNLHVVVAVAKRYADRGIRVFDLIEQGNTALLNAVKSLRLHARLQVHNICDLSRAPSPTKLPRERLADLGVH